MTALHRMNTAPSFLGTRPDCLPIGEAHRAVIRKRRRSQHFATKVLMRAAPILFAGRPTMCPVAQACLAIIVSGFASNFVVVATPRLLSICPNLLFHRARCAVKQWATTAFCVTTIMLFRIAPGFLPVPEAHSAIERFTADGICYRCILSSRCARGK